MWIRCSGSHTPKGLGCHPLLVNPLRHIGPLRTVRVEGSRSAVSSAPSPCPSSTALAASARSPKPGWGLLPTRAPLPHRQVLPAAASITAARTRRVKHSALEPREPASATVAPRSPCVWRCARAPRRQDRRSGPRPGALRAAGSCEDSAAEKRVLWAVTMQNEKLSRFLPQCP